MLTIVPAILPKSLKELEDELAKVWSFVTKVQLDVVDGVWSEVKTIGPEDLSKIDTSVGFDAHLMVFEPEKWLDRCVEGGIERVFGQVEMMKEPATFIADAQAKGLGVGLAYDIETSVEKLFGYIHDLDAVLLLAVKGGEQGREFDERVLEKIKAVRKLDKRITIVIDGGLDEGKIRECLAAEWEEVIREDELDRETMSMEFVIGSHLLSAQDAASELGNLRLAKEH